MATYHYESDICDTDAQVIVQQCNCITKTAQGLAKVLAERFPHADFYSQREKPSKPGTIEMRGGKGKKWICAFYSQRKPGGPTEKEHSLARVEWFKMCLARLANTKGLKSIAFPYKIGCGLAQGDWDVYHRMLIDFAEDNPNLEVHIVSNEPKPVEEDAGEVKGEEDQEAHDVEAYNEMICYAMGVVSGLPCKRSDIDRILKELEALLLPGDADQEEAGESEEEVEPSYQNMSLLEFTKMFTPEGYEDFFNQEIEGGSLEELSAFLEKEEGEIYPPLPLIYTGLEKVKPADIKVIIIGQDPYHGEGQACGISFSVPEGIPPPPSLKNIFQELENDGFTVSDPECGDLTKWCDQGVLMINSALTVRAGDAGSHSKKWLELFTPALIRWLNVHAGPMVILMWGNHAQKIGAGFGERHKKITGVHPSPLSAHKGFFGSKPFSTVNAKLKILKKEPIDWSL